MSSLPEELSDSEKSDLQSRVHVKFFNKSSEEYRERLYSIMNSINDVKPSLPSINNDAFVNQIEQFRNSPSA